MRLTDGPVPQAREWDRTEVAERDYGPPRLRELLTPDPFEALVFLGIVAVVLLAGIIGIQP